MKNVLYTGHIIWNWSKHPQTGQSLYLEVYCNRSHTPIPAIGVTGVSGVTGMVGMAGQMRLNGVVDGQPVVKRRRGRRKNVEGMDLLFMNKNRLPGMSDRVWRVITMKTAIVILFFIFTNLFRKISAISCFYRVLPVGVGLSLGCPLARASLRLLGQWTLRAEFP